MTVTISHRQERKDRRIREAYVPVPDKVAQVQLRNIELAQDVMKEQLQKLMSDPGRVCMARAVHKQALKFGDLTELQRDVLLWITRPNMRAGEIETEGAFKTGQSRSALSSLEWKGYVTSGWRKGKRVWTRTDKKAVGEV